MAYDSVYTGAQIDASVQITQNIVDIIKQQMLESTYPVGSIYMSVNNISPQIFIGGTWERIEDTFLLCAGSTYVAGTTGGEAGHTLTTAETPAHTHTRGTMNIIGEFRAYSEYNLNNTAFGSRLTGPFWYNSNESDNYGTSTNMSSGSQDTIRQIHFDASRNWTGETSSVGGGQAHNNMPPYLSIYVWKRTA